jgi:hypothetical protein
VSRFADKGSSYKDAIAAISRYLIALINRFGDYTLNLVRKLPQPHYGYTLKRTAPLLREANGPFCNESLSSYNFGRNPSSRYRECEST